MFLVMEEVTEQQKLTISGGVGPYSTDWFGIDTNNLVLVIILTTMYQIIMDAQLVECCC